MRTLAIALGALGLAGAASAQPAPVDVTLSPAVQARQGELGRTALEDQRISLERQVDEALARTHRPVRSVSLVIQDIQPNRPTSRQLGTSASLNADSFGVGGAAVTGEVVTAEGAVQPVRYRYFPDSLIDETSFDTWGDAEQTFTTVADAIGRGQPLDQTRSWPPPRAPQTPTGTRISPSGS